MPASTRSRAIFRGPGPYLSRALAVCVLAVACTKVDMETGPANGAAHRHPYTIPHVLRISDATDYASLNPHLDANAWKIAELTMAWLLRSGPDDRPRPELATAVPSQRNGGISADGKTVIYHLRHDAKWSDGVPFTSADVIFSTRAVLDSRNDETMREFFDDVAGVSAPDKYTMVLHLKRPFGGINFSYFYSVSSPCILPAHILARLPNINTAPYNALPVGIGPFKYVRWDRDGQIVLAADPLYFRGRPKLDRIVIRSLPSPLAGYGALRTHAVDLVNWLPFLSGGTENDTQFVITQQQPFQMEFLTLNVRRPPFEDPLVRRAVRLSIDRVRMRKLLVGEAGLGRGPLYPLTDSPYPVGHPMYDPTMPLAPHDPAAAGRLLDRAGWRRGADGVRAKDGRRLEISFAGPAEAPLVHQAEELIRADLRDVGAVLDTRNYVTAFLSAPNGPVHSGNFDITVAGYFLDGFGDLSTFFGCKYLYPNGSNTARFCDHSLDALFSAFNQTYDERVRRSIAARIQRKIYDATPIINLATIDEFWIANSDLRGFRPNRSGVYDAFMNVDI